MLRTWDKSSPIKEMDHIFGIYAPDYPYTEYTECFRGVFYALEAFHPSDSLSLRKIRPELRFGHGHLGKWRESYTAERPEKVFKCHVRNSNFDCTPIWPSWLRR